MNVAAQFEARAGLWLTSVGVKRDYRDRAGNHHAVDEPGVGEDRWVAVVPAVFDAVLCVEFRGAGEG